MARLLVAALVLTTLACASLALPHSENMKAENQESLLVIPGEENSANSKFFLHHLFGFWSNLFRPLPWIPLPGLLPTTVGPPAGNGEDDDDKDDADDDGDEKEDGADDEEDDDEDDDNDDEDEEDNEDDGEEDNEEDENEEEDE